MLKYRMKISEVKKLETTDNARIAHVCFIFVDSECFLKEYFSSSSLATFGSTMFSASVVQGGFVKKSLF